MKWLTFSHFHRKQSFTPSFMVPPANYITTTVLPLGRYNIFYKSAASSNDVCNKNSLDINDVMTSYLMVLDFQSKNQTFLLSTCKCFKSNFQYKML